MNQTPLQIAIKKLHPDAKLPTRGSVQAAGWDIYCLERVIMYADWREVCKTGLSMAIPHGYYGHICDRSGLAARNGITVLGGIIDSDYRGEIHIVLYNSSQDRKEFAPGDRIAQMIFHAHYDAAWTEVDELPATERGEGGLGSTGK